MTQYHNFENVKLGDLVKYNTGGWYNRTVVGRVTKVTSAQFCVGCERFRKSDGKRIGSLYCYCQPANAEDLEQQQAALRKLQVRNEVVSWFNNANNIDSLTLSQLDAIKAIITQKTKKEV